MREKFERIGEVKTFFDLIPDRGLVFITYVRLSLFSSFDSSQPVFFQYDLRAAMMAKDALQGQEVANRPVRRSYSPSFDAHLYLDRRALLSSPRG